MNNGKDGEKMNFTDEDKKTLDEIVKKHKGKQKENAIEKAIDKAFGITERREKKEKMNRIFEKNAKALSAIERMEINNEK